MNRVCINKIWLAIGYNRPRLDDKPRVNQAYLGYTQCELKSIFLNQLVEKQTEKDLKDLPATRFELLDCISHNRRRRVQ